jgi:hypothetical protein
MMDIGTFVLLSIFWIMPAWVVAVVAESRGRIGWGWLVIAMVITPVIAFFVLWAMPRVVPGMKTKTCPACAEDVKEAARICRFCQHDFEAAGLSPPATA